MTTSKPTIPPRSAAARNKSLERIVRGFSNHRRIQILRLVALTPELDVTEIASACGINLKTAAVHVSRLAQAGLVWKRPKGRRVNHMIAPRGTQALRFLNSLK